MQKAVRITTVVIVALVLLLGIYGTAAFLGWQKGQRQRSELAEQEQNAEVARQVQFARADISQDNARLALRRLEWVLEQEPEHVEARTLQIEAEQSLQQNVVVTPIIVASPTAEAAPTPSEESETEPAKRLSQLRALNENEEWQEAISGLNAFQQEFPDFQRRATDELLFTAYVTYGTDLLYTVQAELGLSFLREAEKLGDLPQEASDQRQWARLYLSGISFYNVNWDVAIFYFRELCLSAPFFQDSCDRLEESLVIYAEQYMSIQEWCPAETLLLEAYGLSNDQAVANKLGVARTGCASATPAVGTPLTGTLPLTGSLPLTGTVPGLPGDIPPVIDVP